MDVAAKHEFKNVEINAPVLCYTKMCLYLE